MASNGTPAPLVSVIIPAWNAERTLRDTLASAASQTHRNLEILIIDDGSTDDTAAIAAEFCAADGRARLIRTENRGLAAARNLANDQSSGDYVAPLDADDLWHPEKIARQLRTFADGSPRIGLVYCWYRMIDQQGLVIEPPWAPLFEGAVFERHLALNFGTGSAALIKRSALGELRYNRALRGCEDWLLQLQIAAKFEIACARAFLLGYRAGPANMSSDRRRMAEAHVQMYRILQREYPHRGQRLIRRELARWRARRGLLAGDPADVAKAFATAPLVVGKTILREIYQRYRKPVQRRPLGDPLLALLPDSLDDPPLIGRT